MRCDRKMNAQTTRLVRNFGKFIGRKLIPTRFRARRFIDKALDNVAIRKGGKRVWNKHTWNVAGGFWHKLQYPRITRRIFESLVVNVPMKPNNTIASIGSGLGLYEIYLAKHLVPKGRVRCFDVSSTMVQRASAYAKRAGVKNVEFNEINSHKLPAEDNSANLVMCINAFHYISAETGESKVANELARVADKNNSDTRIFMGFFDGFREYEERERIKQLFSENGFMLDKKLVLREGDLLFGLGQLEEILIFKPIVK